MSVTGYYYLHENGTLIHKVYLDDGQVADFRESDLVKMYWVIDPDDRMTAWNLLVEASALGAEPENIDRLARLWGCNDHDALVYAGFIGCRVYMDGNMWCATRSDCIDLQASKAGFGKTALAAMAELAKALGYRAQKTWGASFPDLLK